MQSNLVYSRNPNIAFRKISHECILVPVRNKIGDLDGIYALNEVSARIWELLDGENSLNQISDTLFNEFEINRQTLNSDLFGIIEELEKIGLVHLRD